MRTSYIFVDLENIEPKSLASFACEPFKIIVFVGANQTKIRLDLAMELQQMGERAEYVQISGSGPNALDFHIAFYIGQWAEKDPDGFFHIVSQDKGYDVLIKHLKARKILVERVKDINSLPLNKTEAKTTLNERVQRMISILQRPKATKPRTVKTLSSAINANFQKQLKATEVQEVIAEMKKAGFISISDTKVVYAGE